MNTPKFKIGDTVKCIGVDKGSSSGWEKDKEFVVREINNHTNNGIPCYFPLPGDGVYEHQLELVSSELSQQTYGYFHIGDTVKVVRFVDSPIPELLNMVGVVESLIDNSYYPIGVKLPNKPTTIAFKPEELEIIREETLINKEKKMDSTKYYKAVQDLPAYVKGAIFRFNGSSYIALSNLWDQKDDQDNNIGLTPKTVEDNPKWFERVYAVQVKGRTVYTTKEKARKLFEESVSSPTKK